MKGQPDCRGAVQEELAQDGRTLVRVAAEVLRNPQWIKKIGVATSTRPMFWANIVRS